MFREQDYKAVILSSSISFDTLRCSEQNVEKQGKYLVPSIIT